MADHAGLVHLYDYDPASGYCIREKIRNGECGCDNKLWERVYTPFGPGTSSSSTNGRYESIDYSVDLAPPFDEADAAWISKLLKSAGKR